MPRSADLLSPSPRALMVPQRVQLWQADAGGARNNDMAVNAQNRAIILNSAVPVLQKIGTWTQAQGTFAPGVATVLNMPLTNVGLIKRLWLVCKFNVQQAAAETLNRTVMGPANCFSNVQLSDLNNQVRINAPGWLLHYVSTARRQLAAQAAFTSDNPTGMGSNYNILKAPAAVTGAANVYMVYEVPLAYSDTDLRGALFAQVINATMNLQATINPNFIAAANGNPVQAVYQSTTNADRGKINSFTIDVYQDYLDQLPRDGNNNYILPPIDMATQYNLISASNAGFVAGSPLGLPYANLRAYLSTFLIYDNGGVLNAGTDITQFQLQTANTMNYFQIPPELAQMLYGRNKVNDDWPPGVYYFSHRERPISTLQFGNTQLLMTPSVVNANAQVLLGYEFMSMQGQLTAAGAIGQGG